MLGEKAGGDARKALWLCYDQVYWQLTFGSARHATPPEVCPDVAPYTVMLDAASKSFAATGLRVGWAVMPLLAVDARDESIDVRPLHPQIPPRQVCVVWKRDRTLSPVAMRLIEIATAVARELSELPESA